MTPRAVTLGSVLVLGAGVAIWDVFLLFDGDKDNTISAVVGDYPWAMGIIGYVCGHLVSKRKTKSPAVTSAGAGVASVGAAQLTGDPLIGFVVAFAGGMAFWPNREASDV